jgi:hypothetical protein
MSGLSLTEQRFRAHYTADEQKAAVLKLINSNMSDHAVASLCGLSVLQVRCLVAENRALTEQSA